jgi:predicted dienelactone hydrolase
MKLSKVLIAVLLLIASVGMIQAMLSKTTKILWYGLVYGPELQEFPKPTGPYAVGTASYHWVDETRKETFVKGSQSPRELMVQFWYPSDAKKDSALFLYMSDKKEETIRRWKNNSPFIPSFIWNRIFNNRTYAIPGAVLSSTKTSYPVLIFSPGYGMSRDQYAVFTEELASHGYIVVSVDHPYISGLTVFPNGHVVNTDMSVMLDQKRTLEEKDRFRIQNLMLCKTDIEFVIDKLVAATSTDEKSIFYTKLDLDCLGAFGHSLGGMAAFKAAFTNARIKACADFDGWAQEALSQHKGIEKPCMYLEHEYRPELSDEDLKEQGLSRKEFTQLIQKEDESAAIFFKDSNYGYHFVLKNLGHMGFSDFILTKKPIAALWKFDVGSAEPYQTIRVINDYIRTFFDKYLKGEEITATKLCGLHPEAIIVKKCNIG